MRTLSKKTGFTVQNGKSNITYYIVTVVWQGVQRWAAWVPMSVLPRFVGCFVNVVCIICVQPTLRSVVLSSEPFLLCVSNIISWNVETCFLTLFEQLRENSFKGLDETEMLLSFLSCSLTCALNITFTAMLTIIGFRKHDGWTCRFFHLQVMSLKII